MHTVPEPPTVEPPESPSPPKVRDHIRQVAAYSILIACLGIGASVASIFWSSSNANLQTDLRRQQEEAAKTNNELQKLKAELGSQRGQDLSNMGGGQQKDSSKQGNMIVTIPSGDTVTVFGGDLQLTLTGTQLDKNISAYLVTASIVSRGYETMGIKRARVGYTATYPENGGFEIKVQAANAHSAKFLVTRLGN